MKLISWNMHILNQKFQKGLDFILEQNPDIVCLQEVNNEALSYLEKTKYHVYKVVNSYGKSKKRYKVILSKTPGKSSNFITQKKERMSIWRKISHKRFGFTKELHNGIYLDLEKLRIINLHLDACSGPFYRLKQFNFALKNSSRKNKTIICGDFNSYGNILTNTFLYPIFNFPFSNVKINEKKELRKLFLKNKLKDVFKKHTTCVNFGFGLHLDYVLVPNSMKIKSVKTYKNRYNSDHKILEVDF